MSARTIWSIIGETGRRRVKYIRSSRCAMELRWWSDRMLVASHRKLYRSDSRPGTHLVLATAGQGNTGDEAMLEAFISKAEGSITVLVSSRHDFPQEILGDPRVKVVEVPHLIDGSLLGRRLRDSWKFCHLMTNARDYSVIGADVMDGLYYVPSSVSRASTVHAAHQLNVPSAILGFSWSSDCIPAAAIALRRAAKYSRLVVRDPESYSRLEALGIQNLVRAADMVFALEIAEVSPRLTVSSWLNSAGRAPIAVVNISGLLRSRYDLERAYIQIFQELIDDGFDIAVLPHVVRAGDDDMAAQQELRTSIPSSWRIHFIDEKLSVGQIKYIVNRAALVVTGRMHLAIIALASHVPALTLATQGKVDGLYALFVHIDGCIKPNDRLADAIRFARRNIAQNNQSLPRGGDVMRAKCLALQNFEHLIQGSEIRKVELCANEAAPNCDGSKCAAKETLG